MEWTIDLIVHKPDFFPTHFFLSNLVALSRNKEHAWTLLYMKSVFGRAHNIHPLRLDGCRVNRLYSSTLQCYHSILQRYCILVPTIEEHNTTHPPRLSKYFSEFSGFIPSPKPEGRSHCWFPCRAGDGLQILINSKIGWKPTFYFYFCVFILFILLFFYFCTPYTSLFSVSHFCFVSILFI